SRSSRARSCIASRSGWCSGWRWRVASPRFRWRCPGAPPPRAAEAPAPSVVSLQLTTLADRVDQAPERGFVERRVVEAQQLREFGGVRVEAALAVVVPVLELVAVARVAARNDARLRGRLVERHPDHRDA